MRVTFKVYRYQPEIREDAYFDSFEFDAERELFDVRKVGSVEGTLDHPAHPVLYAAVHAPTTDTVAIAFAAFDERLP